MKNELDSKMLLSVFDKIRTHGVHQQDSYTLEGVKAYTDFDGYTLFVKDACVTLSFGFHNQYHFDYQNEAQLQAFYKKLTYIAKNY